MYNKILFSSKKYTLVPAEVENPPPTILTERARFAGPHSVVFPATVFQPPRSRAKAQAVKKPLALFSPYPQKIGLLIAPFNIFFQIS
ncbi:MAG: hypothetical protein WBB27_01970 [Maribacter sp.]